MALTSLTWSLSPTLAHGPRAHFNSPGGHQTLPNEWWHKSFSHQLSHAYVWPWTLFIQSPTHKRTFQPHLECAQQPLDCVSPWLPQSDTIITPTSKLTSQLGLGPVSLPWPCLLWTTGWTWLPSPGVPCLSHWGGMMGPGWQGPCPSGPIIPLCSGFLWVISSLLWPISCF